MLSEQCRCPVGGGADGNDAREHDDRDGACREEPIHVYAAPPCEPVAAQLIRVAHERAPTNLLGRHGPAPWAMGPVGGEPALALPADSLARRRCPALSTRRVDAGLLRLALVDAFLELLETRPSDRASCGSRFAPKSTKTMTRMTSSS